MDKLLAVSGLRMHLFTSLGTVKAVDGVSLEVRKGETVGLVGESGCGKTMTAYCIMRLVPSPPGRILEGRIIFNGRDLLEMKEPEIQAVRGGSIAMSFQDPTTYLNPVKKVGDQISEALALHQRLSRVEAWERTVEVMDLVEIPSASSRAHDYPHQFSGGMKQRVMIAMAISCRPKLLILDEPTTGLDVLIQDQILRLIEDLKKTLQTSVLLITHDLGIVAGLCDRVAVMYAGKIVEYAQKRPLFKEPLHPYTKGLLESIPRLGTRQKKLKSIRGTVPDLIRPPLGCRFHPRCPRASAECSRDAPELAPLKRERWVACHHPVE